jgi:hypothetical protein
MIDGSGPRRVLAREIVNVAHACGLPMVGVFNGVDGFTPDTDPRPSSYRPPFMVVVIPANSPSTTSPRSSRSLIRAGH